MTNHTDRPGINRRRVLQGVAWTTPAIVLAVATPPAAASGGENAGQIIVYSQPQIQYRSDLSAVVLALASVQYVQDQNDAPAPASSITMRVVMQVPQVSLNTTDMGAAKNAITFEGGSIGWIVQSVTYNASASTWTIDFLYGSAISRNESTAQLVARIPTATSPHGTVTVSATAMSDGVPISASFPSGNTATL